MKRDHIEITQPLAKMDAKGVTDPEAVFYQPHPDYPRVLIHMSGIDAATGRLDSFLGVSLPKEAVYQIVAAYLGYVERLKESEE
jgi:hypothetical protein